MLTEIIEARNRNGWRTEFRPIAIYFDPHLFPQMCPDGVPSVHGYNRYGGRLVIPLSDLDKGELAKLIKWAARQKPDEPSRDTLQPVDALHYLAHRDEGHPPYAVYIAPR